VGTAERPAQLHEVVGQVGRGERAARDGGGHPLAPEVGRRDHPGHRRQEQIDGVGRVEEVGLVLLQVLVVRERKAAQHAQQAAQVGGQARRLGACQLCRVGVLLLGEHRRARRERVVQLHEAVLVAGPQDDLGAEPRQVHAELSGEVQVVDQRVAAGDRVEAVGAGALEPEVGGHGRPVHGKADPRQRPRAERALAGRREHVTKAGAVAAEHPDVGQEVVGQAHRLGALAVRVPGQERVDVDLRLAQQRLGEPAQQPALGRRPLAQVQQDVGDHLVVAAAGGVQAPAGVADELGQSPLDRCVDVLVGLAEGEVAAAQLVLDARETRGDGVGVVAGDDPLRRQHPGVGARGREVLGPQAAVELEGGVQAIEGLGRLRPEAPAPEARAVRHARAAAGDPDLRRARMTRSSAAQTRSTWAAVISGKKGSAIVEALIASVTGSSPGRWPCASR
jgi:hypothetical protein